MPAGEPWLAAFCVDGRATPAGSFIMLDGMTLQNAQGPGAALARDLTRWLSQAGRRFDPRFPPALEEFYLAETAVLRSRDQMLRSTMGIIVGVCLLPLFLALMPEVRGTLLRLWLGVAMPGAAISVLVFFLPNLSLLTKEWINSAGYLVVCGCFSAIMAASPHPPQVIYLAGMLLTILLHGGLVGMRVQRHLAQSLGVVGIYAITLTAAPRLGGDARVLSVVLLCVSAFFAVHASWRLECELRRAYALTLRERLENGALSAQNRTLGALAGRDELTGLANRRQFNLWLDDIWARPHEAGDSVALLMIDVDFFKFYNDTYGHQAGDQCLRQVASCLRDALRHGSHKVARIGGEEFAAILDDVTLPDARAIAERLRAAVASLGLPHQASGLGFVSISVGVAAARPAPLTGWPALLADADAALYAAKKEGRNRVCAAPGRAAP